MTEVEWLTCVDREQMIEAVKERLTLRKARLLGCACVRRVWDLVLDDRTRRAVAVGERYADGAALEGELADAARAVEDHLRELQWDDSRSAPQSKAAMAALGLCQTTVRGPGALPHGVLMASSAAGHRDYVRRFPEPSRGSVQDFFACEAPEKAAQCDLIRDIVPNPFRPVAFDPRWRTADAVGLAAGIYEERAFDRLPLLGDALMDVGCDDEHLLAHCRSEGPHVRGCWAIDLVLGKE